MSVKRITTDAILTAIALTIFIIELQLPTLVPIPGAKLGLANIITVVALMLLDVKDAFSILLLRIILGGIFSGNGMAVMYSLAGGLLCFAAMLVLRKIVSPKQIWVCSVVGAIFHNIGQVIVAMIVAKSFAMIYYLPFLLITGVVAGVFTGILAQLMCARLKDIIRSGR